MRPCGISTGWELCEPPPTLRPAQPVYEIDPHGNLCREAELDRVTTLDYIRALTVGGERETVEFKSTTAEAETDARTIAGMANQSGGVVIFGVLPDGKVVGQQVTDRSQEKLSAQLRRVTPGPIHSVEKVDIDDRLS